MSIPDVRSTEPIVELAWATETTDTTGMEAEDRGQRADLTRHVTAVVGRDGVVRSHGVYEFAGRWWISQWFLDDGTGFVDADAAKARVQQFYQQESNTLGWNKFRQETVPTPEVLQAMEELAQ